MKYFDGAIKRILANTATNATEVEKAGGQVIIAGTTELSTGANVEAALNAMWKKCPKQIRKKQDWYLYVAGIFGIYMINI